MKKILKALQLGTLAAMLTVLPATELWAGPVYSVTDLGTLGGSSEALAISDSGYIVGDSSPPTDFIRATFYRPGDSPLPLPPGDFISFSRAYGVNNSGVAVGLATFLPGRDHAAVFEIGKTTIDLGSLGGNSSQANAINAAGQIVGSSSTFNNLATHATLFSVGASPIDLGTLGGSFSSAHAINSAGAIVGQSATFGNLSTHAAFFSTTGAPIDLGVLSGYSIASAFGINTSGEIVGTSYGGNSSRATYFDIDGDEIDLGSLGGSSSRADGINDQGVVVGMSTLAGDIEMRAAIFGLGVSPKDLNDLIDPFAGWTLLEATAINSSGAIVGYGRINGEIHAFLATPMSVPEPGSLALFAVAFACLYSVRRTKTRRVC